MMNNPHLAPGTVYEVNLSDGYLAYGIVAARGDVAFFDARSQTRLPIDAMDQTKIAFRVHVMESAFTSKSWSAIGKIALQGGLKDAAKYWMQPVGSNRVYLYNLPEPIEISADERLLYERAAAWAGEHVEQRLLDHFAGRPNATLDALTKLTIYDFN